VREYFFRLEKHLFSVFVLFAAKKRFGWAVFLGGGRAGVYGRGNLIRLPGEKYGKTPNFHAKKCTNGWGKGWKNKKIWRLY